jgi:hypothetical protein
MAARRHLAASKKYMEHNPAIEAELLVELQRAKVAFLGASHRCKKLGTDTFVSPPLLPGSTRQRHHWSR